MFLVADHSGPVYNKEANRGIVRQNADNESQHAGNWVAWSPVI